MKKITAELYQWGKYKLLEFQHNPFSNTNILHRWQFEGEVQSGPTRDKVLCFDPHSQPRHVTQINAAWVGLPRRQKYCVLGKYALTQLVDENGQPYTAKQAAKIVGVPFDTFEESWQRGRQAIITRIENCK